jgi:hypothetical protein
MSFSPMRDEQEDVVKSGALRLTWVSGAIGGIAAIVTAFNEHIFQIFGDDVSDGTKASVLIAIIAAWAAIAVADLLSRAITTAARLKRAPSAITAPEGMKVKLTKGPDAPGWMVAAIRRCDEGTGAASEFLVVNSKEAPKWVTQDEVALER